MSSLERQLDAARAMHSIGVDGGTMATGGEGGDDTLQSDANNKALPPVTAASRVEEITRLHAVLVQERGEVAAAMRVLNEQHGELEFALKRVAEETASIRGAEAVRAASSEERHRELQSVAHDLEEKIGKALPLWVQEGYLVEHSCVRFPVGKGVLVSPPIALTVVPGH